MKGMKLKQRYRVIAHGENCIVTQNLDNKGRPEVGCYNVGFIKPLDSIEPDKNGVKAHVTIDFNKRN